MLEESLAAWKACNAVAISHTERVLQSSSWKGLNLYTWNVLMIDVPQREMLPYAEATAR